MFRRLKPQPDMTAELRALDEHLTSQLMQIHMLVNSNLTASIHAELDATIREVAMMREVIALKRAAGHEPSDEAAQAVAATDARIAELRASLGDRLRATEAAEANSLRDDSLGDTP